MFENDDRPRPKPRTLGIGQPLEGVSIAEMEAQIGALRAEIARLEAEIAKRSDHRAAAEALFKKRPAEER
ncbi:MAG: DUF1192 domain-containing protein [Geminicoccaceae bacterium]|nr:MAG: DUF1192 domain-containing protein [Geminicoccaceae bacterium]